MRIKSLAQGENILMLRIEPSTFVSKVDILTTTPIVHNQSVFSFHVFLSSADSCSLLVPRLSRPTDWSNVFVNCVHVVFCRPLGLVAGVNAICNACLAGVPSGYLKMCPVNLSLF